MPNGVALDDSLIDVNAFMLGDDDYDDGNDMNATSKCTTMEGFGVDNDEMLIVHNDNGDDESHRMDDIVLNNDNDDKDFFWNKGSSSIAPLSPLPKSLEELFSSDSLIVTPETTNKRRSCLYRRRRRPSKRQRPIVNSGINKEGIGVGNHQTGDDEYFFASITDSESVFTSSGGEHDDDDSSRSGNYNNSPVVNNLKGNDDNDERYYIQSCFQNLATSMTRSDESRAVLIQQRLDMPDLYAPLEQPSGEASNITTDSEECNNGSGESPHSGYCSLLSGRKNTRQAEIEQTRRKVLSFAMDHLPPRTVSSISKPSSLTKHLYHPSPSPSPHDHQEARPLTPSLSSSSP